MKRLFGGRSIKDGASLITIDMPLIAEDGAAVPIAVEVKSPMTPENHVKALYILAEKNPRPLNVKINLTPGRGAGLRGDQSAPGRQRAGPRRSPRPATGTLWVATREVRVTVAGCAA